MTQPTQALPSWLTLSETVITLPDGQVSTSATTLTLPLTYYGPSIPLGSDGVWTYGGLTPPPSTTPTPTSAIPTSSSVDTSAITSSPDITSTPAETSPTIVSTSAVPSTSPSSTSAVPTVIAGSAHGISPATLGAILGSILGTLLLLVLIAIFFLLRQTRRRTDPDAPAPQSSSFWNRSTTLMSFQRHSQPIWTGWDLITSEDLRSSGPPTPGDGSPRGSGEEHDPFLTRRSVRSGTDTGHARTDTDTLVSLPIIARAGTHTTSTPKPGEHIIPRDVQMRMDEDTAAPPYAGVRIVERRSSTSDEEDALLPPPLLDPEGRIVRTSRPTSHQSAVSEKSKTGPARSITSEKSAGSNFTDVQEPEGAELLTARRVRVGQLQPFAATPVASTSVAPPTILGLDRLANLGRMSWFRRMSLLGPPAGSQPVPQSEQEASVFDTYTRTPPRHSRNGSRSHPSSQSRPGSFARVSVQEPLTDSFGRRNARDSGLALGTASERPISSVSAASAASGNTMFFDAQSRPTSSIATRSTGGNGNGSTHNNPPTAIPPLLQPSPLAHEVHRSSPSPRSSNVPADRPPAYTAATALSSASARYSELDVLDMPAPRPASPFSAVSGMRSTPPGLPNPAVWRDSHASSTASPGTDSTSGINIDVLEDAPPAADGGWRHLAGGPRLDSRRATFGVPAVVQPTGALRSERGSLHSLHSHLRPQSSGSGPASSRHTMSGSSSSRPTQSSHSHGPTDSSGRSLAHSMSVTFDDQRPGRRRSEVGEVASPPLSAVFPGRGFPSSSPPPGPRMHDDDVFPLPPAYIPGPATATGTMTSSGTRGTAGTDESLTDLSVTTAQTDPITGAVMHVPRLPWRGSGSRPWRGRPAHEDTAW